MKRYQLPEGFRYASLAERKEFYLREFDLDSLSNFLKFRNLENTVFACIPGRHTGIYPKKYRKIAKQVVLFKDLINYKEVGRTLLDYLPEGAYYDRNYYLDKEKCSGCRKPGDCFKCKNFLGQELAFDLDPENVTCPIHGDLEEKMKHRQGLSFCMYEFEVVRSKTLELYELLEKEYRDIRIVYSGRGFHIHVLDAGTIKLSYKQRKNIAERIMKKEIPIDEWVTSGEMRLIRLPYSLHSMVSRICLPLEFNEMEKFDPLKDRRSVPGYLTTSSSR